MASGLGDIFEKSLRTFLKPLIPYWDDPTVSGIFINGPQDIWIEQQDGLHSVEESFSNEHLQQAVRHIAQLSGTLLTEENPQLHTTLPNGADISAILPPLSKQGPVLALRKPTFRDLSLDELVLNDVLSPAAAELLEAAVLARQSILLLGPPRSGTDTLLRALVRMIPSSERLVSLEAQQVHNQPFTHPHVLRFELPESQEHSVPKATQHFLSTLALLRPHRLLLEQLSGPSALEILQVYQDGYPGSIASLRACQPQHGMQRLEGMCLQAAHPPSIRALRAQLASSFQLLVVCHRDIHGKQQVIEITESLGINNFGDYQFLPLFERKHSSEEEHDAISKFTMLPTSAIPSFWPQLGRYGFQNIDRAFFHPDNYDQDGLRIEELNILSQEPVGGKKAQEPSPIYIPVSSSISMSEEPKNIDTEHDNEKSVSPESELPSSQAKATPPVALPAVHMWEEEEIDAPEPELLDPVLTSESHTVNAQDSIQEESHSESMDYSSSDDIFVRKANEPPPLSSRIEDSKQTLSASVMDIESSTDELQGRREERNPQHRLPSSRVDFNQQAMEQLQEEFQKHPGFSVAPIQEVEPNKQRATPPPIPSNASTSLSGSWDTPTRQRPNASANRLRPPVVQEPHYTPDIDDPSQVLDLSDMIADEPRAMEFVSDEDFRQIEEELRVQAPIQKREFSSDTRSIGTIPIEQDMHSVTPMPPSPTRGGMLPPQEPLQNHTSYELDEAEQTQGGTQPVPPQPPPVPAPSQPLIPRPSTPPPTSPRPTAKTRSAGRSVVVRRGRRNTFETPPSYNPQDSASTSIRARPPSVPPRSHHSVQQKPIPQHSHEELDLVLGNNSISSEATVIRGRPVSPKKK